MNLFPAQSEDDVQALPRPFRENFAGAMRGMVEAGAPEGTDPSLVDRYTEKMGSARQPAGLHSLEGLVRWDLDAALREVAQPVALFVVRSIIAKEAIERYGDRIRIELVDLGSRHFPVESPAETTKLLAGEL
ncbi:hypothetical protein [Amycolatopsis rubida]|uniref:hypothetical protein n=1 Tax=Amycolatopsis rubida TaxID=112413 RepID=UPI001AD7EE10|nr:hypothetical protein [Amycolatopsis rubida]